MMIYRLYFLSLSLFILVSDQVTKYVVTRNLSLHERIEVLPFFDLFHIRNRGVAFGLFSENGPVSKSIFFTAGSFALILFIGIYAMKILPKNRKWIFGLALILGGALGNFVDRIRLGYVVDFLDLHVGAYHWPTFNIADSAICAGVGLLALHLWFHKDSQPAPGPA
jgi:signal peptidase II